MVTGGVGFHQQKFAQSSVTAGGTVAMVIDPIPDPSISVAVGETFSKQESLWPQPCYLDTFPPVGGPLELGRFAEVGAATLKALDVSSLSLWPGG